MHPNVALSKSLLLLLVFSSLIACASIPTHTPIAPDVSLENIDLDKLTLSNARFEMTLRIKNPNKFDLPLKGLSFATRIEGRDFATGTSNQRTTIPAQGEGVYKVKIDTRLSSLLKQARDSLMGRRSVNYDISGQLLVSNWPLPISFSKSGQYQP